MSPTLGQGENDDDPLLEEGEVDMRAMMVAGGVMEFELLRLPPQNKTVGPWTFQQGGWGRRKGRGNVVRIQPSHLLRMYLHMCVCVYECACTQCVKVACTMSCVCRLNMLCTLEMCAV